MAARLLMLFTVGSLEALQAVSLEVQDSIHNTDYQDHNVWVSDEKSCNTLVTYSCSKENRGQFESLVDDLYLKLQDAEAHLSHPDDYPPHYDVQPGEEFDFIVVGAGSAGAVVANRLSEVEGWKVLLVEAGGDPPKTSEVPALAPTLHDTYIDWQYRTDPEEEFCLGMEGNRCKWPRGKVLGGTSTINYMMFTRGNPRDFDQWAAAGNQGWSFEEVLPYFKKLENMRDPAVRTSQDFEKYHSTSGLVTLEPWVNNELTEVLDLFADSYKELGYRFIQDYNGKNQTGFTKMHGNLRDHRRCSTAKAFLSSAKGRKNLFLSKHSLATKILIDTDGKKAYGIMLSTKNGPSIEVRAKKEIIVSAGTINSPQLLMLSGIGPKDHLQELGIHVIKDLPVGKNLHDHPLLASIVLSLNLSVSYPPPTLEDTFNFLLKQPSRLSTLGGFPGAAYINTAPGDDYPDVELLQQHIPKNSRELMISALTAFNLKKSLAEELVKLNENSYTVITLASMLRPYSRGRITLQSTDPNVHPKIVTGTFLDKRDVETYLRVYDFMFRLIETEHLKKVGARIHEIPLPGCARYPVSSPEFRECAMRHMTTTTFHHCGTCKMGPAGDPTAVVDPSLRVHGVQGLRVADASVMPTITSGHINAPVIMIGEKVADMIKQAWT